MTISSARWDSLDAELLGIEPACVLFFLRAGTAANFAKPSPDKPGYTRFSVPEDVLLAAVPTVDARALKLACGRLIKHCQTLREFGGPFRDSFHALLGREHIFDIAEPWLRSLEEQGGLDDGADQEQSTGGAEVWRQDKIERLLEKLKTAFPSKWQRVRGDMNPSQMIALWQEILGCFPSQVIDDAVVVLRREYPYDSGIVAASFQQAQWNPFDLHQIEEACWRAMDAKIDQYLPGFPNEDAIWQSALDYSESGEKMFFSSPELNAIVARQLVRLASQALSRHGFLEPVRQLKRAVMADENR